MLRNALLLFSLAVFLACKEPSQVILAEGRTNAQATLQKPYVVMLSIDGFRWDYDSLYDAPHLRRLRREGASAVAMRPGFPSSTFPNHYSLATGLYPGHHGLVNNSFYDTERDALYQMKDREKVEDGSWYGGTPLWVLAEQQGMLSASYFWVGTEANIQGIHPTAYYRYDGSVPNEERIDQVIKWLKQPEKARPHFLTLYFSMVDKMGHRHGPQSGEVAEAVAEADRLVGMLDEKLQALGLPVYLVVTADHGMYHADHDNPVFPERIAPLDDFKFAMGSTAWNLYSADTALVAATEARLLEKADGRYDVYRRGQTPAHLQYGSSHLVGDLVLVARPPHILSRWGYPNSIGHHGYDPMTSEMHCIFYIKGPDIRPGKRIAPFDNVHVYPLLANILGLEMPGGLDGEVAVLDSVRLQEDYPSAATISL